nr:hypothetical protein [Tanacetum cinerariifolium]
MDKSELEKHLSLWRELMNSATTVLQFELDRESDFAHFTSLVPQGGARWRWSGWWQWRGGEVAADVVGLWRRGRRVVESGIWDRIDWKAGNIIGFAGNARRKSFPAAAGGGGGGGRPAQIQTPTAVSISQTDPVVAANHTNTPNLDVLLKQTRPFGSGGVLNGDGAGGSKVVLGEGGVDGGSGEEVRWRRMWWGYGGGGGAWWRVVYGIG